MLGLKTRVLPLRSDVVDGKRFLKDGGESESRPQNLPSPFPVRSINFDQTFTSILLNY
jgi:hypothetical protein